MGLGGQRHAPAVLPLERPGTHCIGGWVGPRVGLDGCEKLAPTGIRTHDHPVRSESLYQLRHPGPVLLSVYHYQDNVNFGYHQWNVLVKTKWLTSWHMSKKLGTERAYIKGLVVFDGIHWILHPPNTWEKMGIEWTSSSALYRLQESLRFS